MKNLIALSTLALFSFAAFGAPSIDNSDPVAPLCDFHLTETAQTGPLPCEVNAPAVSAPSMTVTGRFFGEYNPQPPAFKALYGNQTGPCFYSDGVDVYFTTNVISIVQPLANVNQTQFYMSCVNLQPLPF